MDRNPLKKNPTTQGAMEKGKIFVFGIDGGTWDIILPAIDRGKLPNLRWLIEEGSYGPLQSTIHPITPMAWSSFATGMNAGKHGIFDFSYARQGRLILNTARDRKAPAIWTYLSRAKRPAIVLNVPFTYPPEQIHGIMIPGFDAPKVDRRIFHPETIHEELMDRFGEYRLDWTFPIGEKFAPENYLKKVEKVITHRGETGLYLLKRYPWDFFMIVFTSTDHVQHVFWNLPGGIEYIERTYEAVDQQLGRFIEALPEEATLIVMSDHGAGRINKIVYLDNWLAQEGYFFKVPFSLKRTGLRMLKAILQRNIPTHLRKSLRHRFPMLKNRLEATLQDGHVDWNHTKAYAFGMYGNVCINLKGREPFGIVAPEDYPYLLGEIADKLMALSDPDTGLPIVQKVYRKEELYSGSYTNRAPDLIIQWRDYAYFTKKGIDKGNRIFDDSLMIDASKYPHTGTHRTNGMFVAKGPNVKRSTQINADIIDLAPTILHMMGIAPPDILDGRILSGMFNNHRLQNYPAHPQSQQIDIPVDLKQTVGFSDTEEESIRQRLKSLGYI